jgi:hypothetical protein
MVRKMFEEHVTGKISTIIEQQGGLETQTGGWISRICVPGGKKFVRSGVKV